MGGPFRPLKAAPEPLGIVLCKLLYHSYQRVHPVAIDEPLIDGEVLAIAGGIEEIHVPGHCAGQVALLWRPGRMLFAGDVAANLMDLGDVHLSASLVHAIAADLNAQFESAASIDPL